MGLFTRRSSVPTPRPVEASSAARPTDGHLNGARQVAGETPGAGAATPVMPVGESPSARRFGELLVADGIITQDQLDAALRLQSVARKENPLYYDLIQAFCRRTQIPVILNTSFNENEPIVCAPAEAIDCFQRTRMDALAIGPFLVTKAEN